jgi:hypothetical protein
MRLDYDVDRGPPPMRTVTRYNSNITYNYYLQKRSCSGSRLGDSTSAKYPISDPVTSKLTYSLDRFYLAI